MKEYLIFQITNYTVEKVIISDAKYNYICIIDCYVLISSFVFVADVSVVNEPLSDSVSYFFLVDFFVVYNQRFIYRIIYVNILYL